MFAPLLQQKDVPLTLAVHVQVENIIFDIYTNHVGLELGHRIHPDLEINDMHNVRCRSITYWLRPVC